METAAPKVRYEWLDALRGFTMIMVVANHVSSVGFEQNLKYSSSLSFLLLFRMPLFFFISGFLAYKAAQVWNARALGQLVLKKLKVQIIPTLVFFVLFNAMIWPRFFEGLEMNFHSPQKGGYWFTIALLWMFLFYYLFSFAESRLKHRSWVPMALFFVVSLCAYETCFLPHYFSWAQGYKGPDTLMKSFLGDTSLGQVMRFFPFFLLGNIVRRYWDRAQAVMDNPWFYPIVVVVVILSTMDVLKWHNLQFEWTNLPSTLAKFGLLTIAFMYFRNYQAFFTKRSVIGASLQYIGRRTLDIYLIHFFFLPNIPTIGQFFNKYRHNFVLDTTLAVVIALLVIAFCIITSNILRVSPFFRKYLFGR